MPNPHILLTPGPTPLHPKTQAALTHEMLSHMDPQIFALNKDIQGNLRSIFGCDKSYFTALVAGTGSLGMEAGFANLVERGDEVVICSNGTFGSRMAEMAKRYGAQVKILENFAGQAFSAQEITQALSNKTRLVAVVHGETSTGILNPLEEIAQELKEHPTLLMVDAVTTVGMQPFNMQKLGIDYAYTGSQKCLSAPPGVAPIAVSPRALAHFAQRKDKAPSWYCDLAGLIDYWEKQSYHHTIPVNLHYALNAALKIALEEGLRQRAQRVEKLGKALEKTLSHLGFSAYVSDPEHRLATVLTLNVPQYLDDTQLRQKLSQRNISVTGGLGPSAGKVWRLGLMGETAHPEMYRPLIVALAEILKVPQLSQIFEKELQADKQLAVAS